MIAIGCLAQSLLNKEKRMPNTQSAKRRMRKIIKHAGSAGISKENSKRMFRGDASIDLPASVVKKEIRNARAVRKAIRAGKSVTMPFSEILSF